MYALKRQNRTVGLTMTAGRLDGMISTLEMPDPRFSFATTARRCGGMVLLSLVALSGSACDSTR